MPQLYTIASAARLIGCSANTLYRWAAKGELVPVGTGNGGARLYLLQDVLRIRDLYFRRYSPYAWMPLKTARQTLGVSYKTMMHRYPWIRMVEEYHQGRRRVLCRRADVRRAARG